MGPHGPKEGIEMAPVYNAEVKISLKEGVADPEGQNTLKAIELLGYKGVTRVDSAKFFTLDIEASDRGGAEELLTDICRRLLSNPVIHNFDITVKECETH